MTNKKENNRKKEEPAEGSVEALKAELERLRMEIAYLKKLNALVQNSRPLSHYKKAANRSLFVQEVIAASTNFIALWT